MKEQTMFDKWFLGSISIGKIDVHWLIAHMIKTTTLVTQLTSSFENITTSVNKLAAELAELKEVFSNNNYEREERSTK